jgi:hypothetical protein
MPELCVSESFDERDLQSDKEKPESVAPGTFTNIIRAEANFLRLPLFALNTKNLKSLDGIECQGRITRDGQTQRFVFRATRNTATLYPGPLARAAHLAFLSLLTERGFPLQNPISWCWRDLGRRMGIQVGGETVRQLKQVILSTALLGIHSEFALYSKAHGELITTKESALHLYERVVFLGSTLADGSKADSNLMWISDWYLENLNAMFSAPIDYELWRFLDARSPIASRLYEFLLLNFYSGSPVLRINYETLAQFLPVTRERYRSTAKRQLDHPLTLLTDAGMLSQVDWTEGKSSIAQLHLHRGSKLQSGRSTLVLPPTEDFLETVSVKELRHVRPPEWAIVADFYRLWTGAANHPATEKELHQARSLVANHGIAKTKTLLPLIVKRLKASWPDAKTFGAIAIYLPEALEDFDRGERHKQQVAAEHADLKKEQEERARQAGDQAALKVVWDALPEQDREAIRRSVLAKQPRNITKFPEMLERFCLDEFARRKKVPSSHA